MARAWLPLFYIGLILASRAWASSTSPFRQVDTDTFVDRVQHKRVLSVLLLAGGIACHHLPGLYVASAIYISCS
jgi:hypothetical protein